LNKDVVIHPGGTTAPTKQYPDMKSALDATAEFRDRVKAIAEEMGIHGMFLSAQFQVAEKDGQPAPTGAQCLILYGCAGCAGKETARGLDAVMEFSREFLAGMAAATMLQGRDMLAGLHAMRKAEKEGYQA
jgi:hypothetical protein